MAKTTIKELQTQPAPPAADSEVANPAGAGDQTTPDFQPVAIRGEALSNTVSRERR